MVISEQSCGRTNERTGLVVPLCSRNPHDETVVVRRAQLRLKPGRYSGEGKRASLGRIIGESMLAQRAPSDGRRGSSQVPFLLAERAHQIHQIHTESDADMRAADCYLQCMLFYPTVTGMSVMVSLPKISITFTATT